MNQSSNARIRSFVLVVCIAFPPAFAAAQESVISRTPWQMHPGGDVIYLTEKLPDFGGISNYLHADIPLEDADWVSAPNPDSIGFGGNNTSAIKNSPQYCQTAVDYTYFQTIVTVPTNTSVTEFEIAFKGMDDGARISVFNSKFPDGDIVPGSYVKIGGSGTSDLKDLMVSGRNRVVITQVDICPNGNSLDSAIVKLNGQEVSPVVPTLPETIKLLAYSISNQVRDSSGSAPDYHVAIDKDVGRILEGVDIGTPFEVIKLEGDKIALRVASGPNKGKVLLGEDNRAPIGDNEFAPGAQFYIRTPLEPSMGEFVSLESAAYPGQYLRHQSFDLKIDTADASSPSLLRRDATFRFEPVEAVAD